MNYAQARVRSSDGRWDWTTMNDGNVWASGPCSEHTDGHETREDAERHYWNWMLDQTSIRVTTVVGALYPCKVCGAYTDSLVMLRDGYTGFVLCPNHHERADLERAYPFVPGLQETYS